MSGIPSILEPSERMGREAYRAWLSRQPKRRFERICGVVVAMAPERASHNLRKAMAWQTLRQAVQAAGLACEVYTGGMTVEVGDSDYEPDTVLRCGASLPPDAVSVTDPLVIVEVLSPSTSATDRAWKLREYFRLPSMRHYLIVWPDKQMIVHHRRGVADDIETQTVVSGKIELSPPGITITVEDIYR